MGASVRKAGGGGSRRGRGRGGAAPMSEINVTPFVDVMLVLLIIFMVAAPLLTVGVPLELPKTKAEPLPQEQEEPLTVNLDAAGKIYIQKTEITRDELITKLNAIAAQRESKKIFLRADRTLDYGMVMEVMGDLNAGGFKSIGLVTDQAVPSGDGGG